MIRHAYCAIVATALFALAACDSVGIGSLDLGFGGSAATYDWNIHGTVSDAATMEPVSRAYVIFAEPYHRATTRPDGTYTIPGVSEFCHDVRVEAVGYATWTGKRCVGPAMTSHDFLLTPSSTQE